jgi:hypothetical protein
MATEEDAKEVAVSNAKKVDVTAFDTVAPEVAQVVEITSASGQPYSKTKPNKRDASSTHESSSDNKEAGSTDTSLNGMSGESHDMHCAISAGSGSALSSGAKNTDEAALAVVSSTNSDRLSPVQTPGGHWAKQGGLGSWGVGEGEKMLPTFPPPYNYKHEKISEHAPTRGSKPRAGRTSNNNATSQRTQRQEDRQSGRLGKHQEKTQVNQRAKKTFFTSSVSQSMLGGLDDVVR